MPAHVRQRFLHDTEERGGRQRREARVVGIDAQSGGHVKALREVVRQPLQRRGEAEIIQQWRAMISSGV